MLLDDGTLVKFINIPAFEGKCGIVIESFRIFADTYYHVWVDGKLMVAGRIILEEISDFYEEKL